MDLIFLAYFQFFPNQFVYFAPPLHLYCRGFLLCGLFLGAVLQRKGSRMGKAVFFTICAVLCAAFEILAVTRVREIGDGVLACLVFEFMVMSALFGAVFGILLYKLWTKVHH